MGIINLTPDSFYDGHIYLTQKSVQSKFDNVKEAHILDIGAESSRPGSKMITIDEEINRLNNFIKLDFHHKCFSIDSYKPEVIKYCLDRGFGMINDISGGGNNFINIDLAKKYNVPICIMHMKGKPETMQNNPTYENILDEILSFFEKRINYCNSIGYNLNQLILDPGIGFGKTKEDNYKIIKNISKFKNLGCKILLGVSRKSLLEFNGNQPKDRLYSSLALQSICIYEGVDIIRTHDVNQLTDCLNVLSNLN